MHYYDSAGQSLAACAVAERAIEDVRVQIPGCAIAVQKYRFGAKIADRIAACDEGERRAKDLVAGADAEKTQSEVYGGGTAAKGDRRHADAGLEVPFEGGDIWADRG